MKKLSALVAGIALVITLFFSGAEPAFATTGNSPNYYKSMTNFRRAIPGARNFRRRLFEQQFEEMQEAEEEEEMEEEGGDSDDEAVDEEDTEEVDEEEEKKNTSFKSRRQMLREAAQKRIREAIEGRKFSGERRDSKTYYERDSRARDTAQRRIREAKDHGIRMRNGEWTRSHDRDQAGIEDKEAERERIREAIRKEERRRYEAVTGDGDCAGLTRSRLAICQYRNRVDAE